MKDGTQRPDTSAHKSLWDQIRFNSEASERVREAVEKDLEPYNARIVEGVERVNKLLWTAGQLTNPLIGRGQLDDQTREASQDILRAAVVLIHAYLEDFLRTIAGALLPVGDEKCLAGVPLAGLTSRAEKFTLGQLLPHKGKSIDDVLRQSVSEHLDRSTFNSIQDITALLEKLGFDVAKHAEEFPVIDQMIQRRHYIVHRADRVKASGSETYALQPIHLADVSLWLEATIIFMSGLMAPFLIKLNPLEELAKKLNIKLLEGTK